MTPLEFAVLLLIAGLIGVVGEMLIGYWKGGLVVSIGIGLVGAALGTWMARSLDLPDLLSVQIGAESFPLVWAVAGAALFVFAIRVFFAPRRPSGV